MIEFHPFSDVWRLFNDEEFAALKTDIAAHGQRLPIILYQGKVLDGRNRYRACRELGIEPRCETAKVKNDDDALMLVVSLNEQRRHLSMAERTFAAERLATLLRGTNQYLKGVDASIEAPTRLQAAKLMDVSIGSLERARRIAADGDKELQQAVCDGRISLSAADDQVRRKRKPTAKPSGPSLRERVMASRDARARRMHRLTPNEVDPKYTSSSREFVEEHGHVQIKTAKEKDRERRLGKLSTITGAIANMASAAEDILNLPELDDADFDLWFNGIAANRRLILPKRIDQIERALQRIHDNRLIRPIGIVAGTDMASS